jgi:O-antigen/teichoic acid export membrane protein
MNNIVYSAAGYAWPIVFSVFITPVVVHKLGTAEYGVLVLLNTLYGFLALVDLGLGTALIKYISAYHATGDSVRLRAMANSGNTLFSLIGVVGFVLFSLVGFFLLPLFHVEGGGHFTVVFILAGLVFFLNSSMQVYAIVISALQRYDIAVRLSLGQLTVYNVAILIAVLCGFGLRTMYVINIISTVGLVIFWYVHVRRLLPGTRFGFSWVREEIIKAYQFGLLAAVATFSNSALAQLDRLLIPLYTGPVQLSYYSLPGSVAQKSAGLTGSLGTILFPLTSTLESLGNVAAIEAVYRRCFRGVTVVAAAVCVAIATFRYHILYFWLGKDFAEQGSHILLILTGTYFILSVYAPLTNFLLGLGKVRFLTFVSVVLAALNLVALLLLLPTYGIVGAAWAFLIGVLPVPVIFYWTERAILRLSGIGMFYAKLYLRILIVAGISYGVIEYLFLPFVQNLWSLLFFGAVGVVLFVVLYVFLGFAEKEDVALVTGYVRSLLRRIGGVQRRSV